MFYRFQASELMKEWTKLVCLSNELQPYPLNKDEFLSNLTEAIKFAITNGSLTPLSKEGFPVSQKNLELSTYFIDLQDFCDWGKTLPNSGIPDEEFELAHMLGIHNLDENTEPLRIFQNLAPKTQKFHKASESLKTDHLGRLLGKHDALALPSTPPFCVFRVTTSKSTNDLPDSTRRLAALREIGGSTKYFKGKWKFTKIKKLSEQEKAEGRARTDEKTVRKDVYEAVLEEDRLKRAGEL